MLSALTAAAPAILGGVASAGTGYGLSKLFGGGSSGDWRTAAGQFQGPVGINAGGLTSSFANNALTLAPTAERLAAIQGIQDALRAQAGEVGGLRGLVAPGMSKLRDVRLAEIEAARQQAIGNLRENMARRRMMGSSFAGDALARAEAQFGGMREKTAAESLLQELELTNNLINQQYGLDRQAFQTGLDDLNLQANVAAGLTAKATEVMQKQAQFMSEMTAKEAAASGQFYGKMFEPATKAIGEGVTAGTRSLFGPTTAASSISRPVSVPSYTGTSNFFGAY